MTNYSPTAFSREIAARIRGHLARFDIKQADLALLCDISQSQFSKILRGDRPMTLDQLVVICDAVEIDLGSLVDDVEHFISERDLTPSPIVFVTDQFRTPEPIRRSESSLDDWGRSTLARLNVADTP